MKHATLTTYLNDHLALMTSELELLERVRKENAGSTLADSVAAFREAVERQRDRVQDLLEAAGGSISSFKQAAAWLGEKLGRLKPNDGLTEYTDLARVVELELLMGLASSRRLMWSALEHAGTTCGLLPDERTAAEQQALTQLASLQEHHQRAAAAAFGEMAATASRIH